MTNDGEAYDLLKEGGVVRIDLPTTPLQIISLHLTRYHDLLQTLIVMAMRHDDIDRVARVERLKQQTKAG